MSKFRILRSPKHHLLRLHRVTPPWRQWLNRDNQMYISSQVKSALRKLKDWEKARIVTAYYSCQIYLHCTNLVLHIWLNGPLYLLNLNAFNGKILNHVSSICLRETFLLMKLNCLTNTKTCLSSCKNTINQMQFIVKWWNMTDGQNILQLAITIECFNELIKIAQFYCSVMAHYANVERFFPCCSHKPK